MGYEKDSINYRLWDPANKTIHVSCHVDFNEVVEESVKSDIVAEKSKKKIFFQWSFGDYDDMELEDNLEDHPEDYLEDQSENQPEEVGEQLNNEQVTTERQLRDRSKIRKPDRYTEDEGYAFYCRLSTDDI